jgi:hypothetical protein
MGTTPLTLGNDPASADWVPVDACTLPTVEQPLRVAEFDELFASALRGLERPDAQRARLVLTGDQMLPAHVQRLVDAESSCCSFFTFTVDQLEAHLSAEPGQAAVELTIEVPAARTEVLAALVFRAERVRQVSS